nr:hypothetical protein [Tanacetum cinerariifolium]
MLANKRTWKGNPNGSSSKQNKGHKVPRAHTAWLINKKAYAGSLPLCNQYKFHHNGTCTVKFGNYKKVGHIIQNYRTPATAKNQRSCTCYECGSLRHYKSECLIVKFHKRVDMIHERAVDRVKMDSMSIKVSSSSDSSICDTPRMNFNFGGMEFIPSGGIRE